jgi:hypothetical protein
MSRLHERQCRVLSLRTVVWPHCVFIVLDRGWKVKDQSVSVVQKEDRAQRLCYCPAKRYSRCDSK